MLHEKLIAIQNELKAPKTQFNKFGGYYYRSCDDILESVKPILEKFKATIVVSDKIELIGDRYYVVAEAKMLDTEDENQNPIIAYGYAREDEEKKGMDKAQITGSCSSYARKYALNGLLLIDDSKDADTDEFTETQKNAASNTSKNASNSNSKPATSKTSNDMPKPDANGNWICESCGKPVTADGRGETKQLPKQIVEYAWKTRHKCLCYQCLSASVKNA